MKRKLQLAAAAAAVCLSLFPLGLCEVSAESETFTDETLTYEKIDGGVRIIKSVNNITSITIPRTIDGYPILEIGDYAFAECTKLDTVKIEGDVRSLGEGAFSMCYMLTSLTLPDTLETIGEGAFSYCGGLTALSLPDSVTSIGPAAFSYCMSLTELTIPPQVKTLPDYAFYRAVCLERVTLPDTLESIGSTCFVECRSLEALHIPASVQTIGALPVISASSLAEITADPDCPACTVTDNVLYDKDGKTLLVYPAGDPRTEFTVPAGVETVAPYAFSAAGTLEALHLDGVKELGEGALSGCVGLSDVSLPASMTTIPRSLFADCAGLKSYTVPEQITEIGDYAFFGCTGLTALSLPEGLEYIGTQAFCSCPLLRQVTVPESVTSIGDFAFGFVYDDEDSNATAPAAVPDFTLRGKANSAAHTYATAAGLQFDKYGLDKNVVLAVAIALAVVAAAAAVVLWRRNHPKPTKEEREAALAEEAAQDFDPNYRSILDDDEDEDEPETPAPHRPQEEVEEDPYDRSYGFATEAPDLDAADDTNEGEEKEEE